MRWPWISRSAHEAITGLMQTQIEELKAERTVLYDRLGLIGLGGPLFDKPTQVEEPEPEPEPELVDPNKQLNELLAVRRYPAMLKKVVQRQVMEAARERNSPPSVAWIPDSKARVKAAMDQAEAAGRKQA